MNKIEKGQLLKVVGGLSRSQIVSTTFKALYVVIVESKKLFINPLFPKSLTYSCPILLAFDLGGVFVKFTV